MATTDSRNLPRAGPSAPTVGIARVPAPATEQFRGLFPFVTGRIGCHFGQSSKRRARTIDPSDAIPTPDAGFDVALATKTAEPAPGANALVWKPYRLLDAPCSADTFTGPVHRPLHEGPHDCRHSTKHGTLHPLEKASGIRLGNEGHDGRRSLACLAILHALLGRFKGRARWMGLLDRVCLALDCRQPDDGNKSNHVLAGLEPGQGAPLAF